MNDQLIAETSDNTQHLRQTNTNALGGIQIHISVRDRLQTDALEDKATGIGFT